jgi:hypothetical protein
MEDEYYTGRQRRVVYKRPPETDKVNPDLSLEECIERRAEISRLMSEMAESIDSIKGQLDAAKLGTPTETVWIRRASGALRFYVRQHGDHQRAYWNINRRVLKLEQQDSARQFVRAAKTFLPKDTYSQIWALVGEGDGAVSAQQ